MAEHTPDVLRRLIAAADGDDETISSALRRLGAEAAADILVDELVSRADFDELVDYPPITTRLDLRFDGGTVTRDLTVVKGDVLPRIEGEPQAVISQDLTDLVRAVFGPAVVRRNPTRSILWNHLEEPGSLFQRPWVFTTVRHLLRGTEDLTPDLPELSLKFGSDKWGLHYYLPRYDEHFRRFRDVPATVLEIGVGMGADHVEWAKSRPRSLTGVDLTPRAIEHTRTRLALYGLPSRLEVADAERRAYWHARHSS